MHAGIQALHLGDHLTGAGQHAAVFPGVEQAQLDIGPLVKLVDELVLPDCQQIIDYQAHMHSAVGGVHRALQDDPAGIVRIPEICLDVDRRDRRIDKRQARGQPVVTVVQ